MYIELEAPCVDHAEAVGLNKAAAPRTARAARPPQRFEAIIGLILIEILMRIEREVSYFRRWTDLNDVL